MIEIVDQVFEAAVNSYDAVVVYFWADWCQPCQTVAPLMERMEEKYEAVPFLKANVDANMTSAYKAGVRQIPTVMVFENGVKVKEITTGISQIALEALIAPYNIEALV